MLDPLLILVLMVAEAVRPFAVLVYLWAAVAVIRAANAATRYFRSFSPPR
jgi:hypothetical protein